MHVGRVCQGGDTENWLSGGVGLIEPARGYRSIGGGTTDFSAQAQKKRGGRAKEQKNWGRKRRFLRAQKDV